MSDRSLTIGVILLVVVSLCDALYPPLFGVGEGVTADVIVIGLALGVLTLIPLGLWAAWTRRQTGRPRAAMWVAVAVRVLSALSAIPAFFLSEVPTGAKIAAGFVIVLTIAGVLMVRGELVRATTRTEPRARQR
ncbi:MAG TPA: hypothetical protein VGO94_09190 [Mycobacteriales bacterium]|jgi:hypothetical protein|nr:hypothetical protein [Mycobacteriales bacterium]